MRFVNKTTLYTLEQNVQVGELKVTLCAQAWVGQDDEMDIEFIDTENIEYMGIPISGYDNWSKFKKFHKEMGIDFDEQLSSKFDGIFTKENVKEFIKSL